MADGQRGRCHVRRRQRRRHGRCRRRRAGTGMAGRGRPAGQARRPRRAGALCRWLAGRRWRPHQCLAGEPCVSRITTGSTAMSVAAAAGSQGLWFVSRASGLVTLVLFSVVLVLGVAGRTGAAPRHWPRFVFVELHRTLALFLIAFLALHVLTAILDPFVSIGWPATVLPFVSGYRTLAIGLGTLAVDLGGAVLLTSVARRRLGFRAWRAVHWLAYLAWPAAFAHSLTAGNDLGIWWVAMVEWGCAAAVATAVLARIIADIRHDPGSSTPAGRPSAAFERVTAQARTHRESAAPTAASGTPGRPPISCRACCRRTAGPNPPAWRSTLPGTARSGQLAASRSEEHTAEL